MKRLLPLVAWLFFVTSNLSAQNCVAAFQYAPDSSGYGYNFYASTIFGNFLYDWDFGDNTSSTLANPFHQYNANGVYVVCLTVSEMQNGVIICTDTRCDSILVGTLGGGGGCQAVFAPSVSGITASFTDMSTGNPTSWSWSFGDGTGSSLQNPTHTYASSGTYTVCLTISTGLLGCSNTTCSTITITGGSGSCAADFYAVPDTTPLGGNEWHFFNTSTGGFNQVLWDFGDGNSSTQNDPFHIYNTNGAFRVCLTIFGPNCQDVYCDSVFVNSTGGGNCVANFSNSISGNTASFTDISTGSPTVWSWDFGDGSTSNSQNPSHTYANAGTYNVCLSIWDNNGTCQSSWCDALVIGGGSGTCQAAFTAQPDSMPVFGTGWQFTNLSTGNYNTSLWDFGDGTTSTATNPFHTYSSSGTYVVCLTITLAQVGAILCTSTTCDTLNTTTTGPGLYRLGGMVITANNFADAATVYLITLDSLLLTAVDSQATVQGSYGFMNVPAGNYRVKAALTPSSSVYASYLPTYHASELFWSTADVVNLTTDNFGVDINMVAGNNPGGPGFVGGLVTQGANKTSGVGDPIGGAQVMLLDMSDNPIQYVYSDVNGEFEFSNVDYGTYQVYVERLGIPTDPSIVTISANNPSISTVDVRINDSEVYSSVPLFDLFSTAPNLYPNPAQGAVVLSFALNNAEEIAVEITNGLGQIIQIQTEETGVGLHQIHISTHRFASGLYFVNLKVDGQNAAIFRLLK